MKVFKAYWHCFIRAVISVPLIATSVLILINQGFFLNIEANWETVGLCMLATAGLLIPYTTKIFIWRFEIDLDAGTACVCFYPAFFGWERYYIGIDPQWNFDMFLSEIQSVEVVKLTPEEKAKYTSIPTRFNKFFKIELPHGKYKYIYATPFSKRQQQEIIKVLLSQNPTRNK